MNPRRVVAALAAVLAALALFVGGVIVGGHPEATGLTQLKDPWRGILLGDSGEALSDQVLDVLRDRYYVEVDATGLERTSVQALVDSLDDPYTDYLDPDELEALRARTNGEFFGVGLAVEARDGAVVVTRVETGGPAAAAGIREGDRITAVDGRPTEGRSLDLVVSEIRGPRGTTVRLGIRTGDAAARTIPLERRFRFTVTAVAGEIRRVGDVKVGYVILGRFTRGSARALRREVADLRAKGAQALVLDLRGDPGGLVNEAVAAAGVFLPDGSTVVTTEGLHSPERVYRTSDAPGAGDLPLIVLVDRNSASASEILAGALRDAERGRLVGERTFGKALVQTTVVLRDGGALKLTTARYLTPSGYDLAKRGLPPAVAVADDPATPVNEVLQRGLELAAAAA